MRRLCLALFLVTSFPALAPAQAPQDPRGQGYVLFAPGVTSGGKGTVHFGGGGEGLMYKGLGLGAELGYVAPRRYVGEGLGVFSVNGSYHFQLRGESRKVEPFVTSGYSLFFRSGSVSGFNFGGGVNYWFQEHLGLRLELRDDVVGIEETIHLVGFRIGLAFR